MALDYPSGPMEPDALVPEGSEGRLTEVKGSRVAQARLLLSLRQTRKAFSLLNEILSENPEDAEAQSLMALALLGTGDSYESIQHLKRAIQLQPLNPAHRFNLGHALERCGDHEPALEAYREALDLDPAYQRAAGAIERLTDPTPRPLPASPSSLLGRRSTLFRVFRPRRKNPTWLMALLHRLQRRRR